MVDVWYLKVYNSNYGDSGTGGELMYKAQEECFENHNKGVLVSDAVASQLKGIDTSEYPMLGPNTTKDDYKEAAFIMNNSPYTALELEKFRLYNKGHNMSDESNKNGEGNNNPGEFCAITDVGKDLKRGVTKSKCDSSRDDTRRMTKEERDDWYKNIVSNAMEVINDDRFTKPHMQNLEENINEMFIGVHDIVNEMEPLKNGGENSLEWYGKNGKSTK